MIRVDDCVQGITTEVEGKLSRIREGRRGSWEGSMRGKNRCRKLVECLKAKIHDMRKLKWKFKLVDSYE
jgi:hypothetical protein